MPLEEFERLSANEQGLGWLMKGRYLTARSMIHYVVKLQAVDAAFVEVWHNINANQVEYLLGYTTSVAVDVYSADRWFDLK